MRAASGQVVTALGSQLVSSATNATVSLAVLKYAGDGQAGLFATIWALYFLAAGYGKGAFVYGRDAEEMLPGHRALSTLCFGSILSAGFVTWLWLTREPALALVVGASLPGLMLHEIERQASLVQNARTALRLDLIWFLSSATGLGLLLLLFDARGLDYFAAIWGGCAWLSVVVVVRLPSDALNERRLRPFGHWRSGLETLLSGAALSVLTLAVASRLGYRDAGFLRACQVLLMPVRSLQAIGQPLLLGVYRKQLEAGLGRRLIYDLVLGGGLLALVLALSGSGSFTLWSIGDRLFAPEVVPSQRVLWSYSVVLALLAAQMPLVSRARAAGRSGRLALWRLCGLGATWVSLSLAAEELSRAIEISALVTFAMLILGMSLNRSRILGVRESSGSVATAPAVARTK